MQDPNAKFKFITYKYHRIQCFATFATRILFRSFFFFITFTLSYRCQLHIIFTQMFCKRQIFITNNNKYSKHFNASTIIFCSVAQLPGMMRMSNNGAPIYLTSQRGPVEQFSQLSGRKIKIFLIIFGKSVIFFGIRHTYYKYIITRGNLSVLTKPRSSIKSVCVLRSQKTQKIAQLNKETHTKPKLTNTLFADG